MSNAKHTPGPWTYHKMEEWTRAEDSGKISIIAHGPIAYTGDNGNGPGNAEANAALIAAAPDLLAALSELASYCADALDAAVLSEEEMAENGLMGLAYAAIAKAEGMDR